VRKTYEFYENKEGSATVTTWKLFTVRKRVSADRSQARQGKKLLSYSVATHGGGGGIIGKRLREKKGGKNSLPAGKISPLPKSGGAFLSVGKRKQEGWGEGIAGGVPISKSVEKSCFSEKSKEAERGIGKGSTETGTGNRLEKRNGMAAVDQALSGVDSLEQLKTSSVEKGNQDREKADVTERSSGSTKAVCAA